MKGKGVKKIIDDKGFVQYYEKKLTPNEKRFYDKIQGCNIAPDFKILKDEEGNDFIKMRAYDMTLAYYIEMNELWDLSDLNHITLKINYQIRRLHDLGIVHVDLHTKNILIDPSSDLTDPKKLDIRIIDFDLSRFINELCKEDFVDFKTFLPKFQYNKDWSLKSMIEYLLMYEFEMWKFDYF
jgi:tRNA A-37 threonylcarbamoyl transferase component Bud32